MADPQALVVAAAEAEAAADTAAAAATDNDTAVQLCSFAVTGARTSLQAVYVCRTCCPGEVWLCVCQACADRCHATCDGLEYLGMGQSYCDCHAINAGCRIREESAREAARVNARDATANVLRCGADDGRRAGGGGDDDVMEVFAMASLEDGGALSRRLGRQAQELIQYSRETFWVDAALVRSAALCELEEMAWAIFCQHQERYGFNAPDGASNPSGCVVGAEWWVQVKPLSTPVAASPGTAPSDGSEAIDLHYDKDEVLAEMFGIGEFPALSTVTYLSRTAGAAPTVVVARRYDQPEDTPIPTMLVSHPRLGKHLAFDGTLLHGAPAHPALREPPPPPPPPETTAPAAEDAVHAVTEADDRRITFLVNIWVGHRPAGVQPLEPGIRELLRAPGPTGGVETRSNGWDEVFALRTRTFPKLSLTGPDDLEELRRDRIYLPFVSKGTTWQTQTDDDEMELVLSTFVPPRMAAGATTCLFWFGPGLEAFLESPPDEFVDEEEADA